MLSPNQTLPGQSVRDLWTGDITPAGSGDANRFMSIPCVSTVDFGFSPALGEPAFPYHTGFDSFEWMDQVGDPGWKHHITSAQIWSLMAAHLIEPGVLKMSVMDYTLAFRRWLEEIGDPDSWSSEVDLTVMMDAIERLSVAAYGFDNYAGSLEEPQCARWRFWVGCRRNPAIRGATKVLMAFERGSFSMSRD